MLTTHLKGKENQQGKEKKPSSMIITHEISAAIIGRFDRLMDFLEGKKSEELQRKIYEQVGTLKTSNDQMEDALKKGK